MRKQNHEKLRVNYGPHGVPVLGKSGYSDTGLRLTEPGDVVVAIAQFEATHGVSPTFGYRQPREGIGVCGGMPVSTPRQAWLVLDYERGLTLIERERAKKAEAERDKLKEELAIWRGPECTDMECPDYDGEHPYHNNARVVGHESGQQKLRGWIVGLKAQLADVSAAQSYDRGLLCEIAQALDAPDAEDGSVPVGELPQTCERLKTELAATQATLLKAIPPGGGASDDTGSVPVSKIAGAIVRDLTKVLAERDHWRKKWEDLEVKRASCCVAVEEENKKLKADLAACQEKAEELCSAVDNLDDLQGHDSVLLKKHLLPCSDLDFCVVSLVRQRAKAIRALAKKGTDK